MSKYRICINIKRPGWDNVKKAYDEINRFDIDERYEKVGGGLLEEYQRDSIAYGNTCALRVSYALNYGGMPIEDALNKCKEKTEKEIDQLQNIKNNIKRYKKTDLYNNYYITGVLDMETFLWIVFGKPEFLIKNMTIRQQNEEALQKLINRNETGVVTMRINFGGANGHTTLWDKNSFADNSNYLSESQVLADGTTLYNSCIVKEIHFWGLK